MTGAFVVLFGRFNFDHWADASPVAVGGGASLIKTIMVMAEFLKDYDPLYMIDFESASLFMMVLTATETVS